jgi:hypothetical protein
MAYTTNTDVKTYIGGISGSGDDALLTVLITAAEAFIESWTGWDFEASSNSTRNFTVGRDTEGPYTLWFDDGAASINEVLNGDSSNTEVTSSQYVTIPSNDTPYYGIKILRSASKVWEFDQDPEDAIAVSAAWGWSASPPADIVQACKDIVKQIYRSRDANSDVNLVSGGIVITPNQIPKLAMQTLEIYKKRA